MGDVIGVGRYRIGQAAAGGRYAAGVTGPQGIGDDLAAYDVARGVGSLVQGDTGGPRDVQGEDREVGLRPVARLDVEGVVARRGGDA